MAQKRENIRLPPIPYKVAGECIHLLRNPFMILNYKAKTIKQHFCKHIYLCSKWTLVNEVNQSAVHVLLHVDIFHCFFVLLSKFIDVHIVFFPLQSSVYIYMYMFLCVC